MKQLKYLVAIAGLAVFTSCGNTSENKVASTATDSQSTNMETPVASSKTYGIGDQVPNNEVCMVNNAYMGRLQFEVPFEGKTYYGCCDMCVERIPKDPAARQAIDPNTMKEVDKANAYIVLSGMRGEVTYFENEKSYQDYIKS